MKSPIKQELEWCKSHRGESGKSLDFEDGFIAGLKQALLFEKSVEQKMHLTAFGNGMIVASSIWFFVSLAITIFING